MLRIGTQHKLWGLKRASVLLRSVTCSYYPCHHPQLSHEICVSAFPHTHLTSASLHYLLPMYIRVTSNLAPMYLRSALTRLTFPMHLLIARTWGEDEHLQWEIREQKHNDSSLSGQTCGFYTPTSLVRRHPGSRCLVCPAPANWRTLAWEDNHL